MSGKTLGDTILEVENLETHLDTKMGLVKAVDGVSFSLRRGETLGIVGESGSGKSMTALSILRLAPRPAARIVGGRVLLNGEDLLRYGAAEMRRVRGRRISMVLQDPQTSLNPVYTVGGQIAEAIATLRDVPRSELLGRAVAALRKGAGRGTRATGARLPAPVERRHEAACGGRNRDLLRAPDPDCRRADDRARCHDPGSVPALVEGHPARVRSLDHIHHP